MKDHRKEQLRARRIQEVYRATGSIRATVRHLRVSIHVVRRVLRGNPARSPVATPRKQPSKLDPYRGLIENLVVEKHLSAVRVLEELRPLGYAGGYSILKAAVRLMRPAGKKRPTTVLEHPPGEEGQMDWSPYTVKLGDREVLVYCFSLVIVFSRYLFVRFVLDETLETITALHEQAFADVGAVPRKQTYDNMTTVGRHIGPGQVWINPRFEAWAAPYKFDIVILPPGKPNLHGCVERPFHYIENNFLAGREFADLDDLNQKAAWWCRERANVRVHGTLRERPVDRLVRERPLMHPLPGVVVEGYRTLSRKVGTDFCVAVDSNRYSVEPRHVGQKATIHLFTDRLEIFVGGERVSVHCLDTRQHQRNVLPEHEEAFKQITPQRSLLANAFQRMGTVAKDYYEGLRAQRGSAAGYHLQRLLKLADRYGTSVVVAAMAHAARYGNYSAEAVARVIAGRQIRRAATSAAASSEPIPLPPEQVRAWLEAMVVETADLADYDKKIDGFDENRKPKDDEDGPGADKPSVTSSSVRADDPEDQ